MPNQRIKATQNQEITRVRQISFQTIAATQAQTETNHARVFLFMSNLSDKTENNVEFILQLGIRFRTRPQTKPNNKTQNKEPDQIHEPKVINLSNLILSDIEFKVLEKGLKFTPMPRLKHIEDITNDPVAFCKRLR